MYIKKELQHRSSFLCIITALIRISISDHLRNGSFTFSGKCDILKLYADNSKTKIRKAADSIKVFDFDNTLYHGESSIDMAFHMINNNRKILLYVPSILINLAKYKLCLVDKEKAEQSINDFLKFAISDKREVDEIVKSFWEKNSCKLDQNMIKRIGKDDLIMTAGPDILINGVRDKLNTENIISSIIDTDKREMVYFNFGENKAKRYKELYGDTPIESFYTDSFNDRSMMKLAQKVYIVEKGKLKKLSAKGMAKL